MNKTINDGGPAYPVHTYDHCEGLGQIVRLTDYGMTLRDYFAAKAMQGQLASMTNADCIRAWVEFAESNGMNLYQHAAISAYLFADAMLAQRNQ